MKKYIPVLCSFILIIVTTTTLVTTDYVKAQFNIVVPGLMQFAQWMLIYLNVAEFGYSIARSSQLKKSVISVCFCELLLRLYSHNLKRDE